MLLSSIESDWEKVKVQFQSGYVFMHAYKAPCSSEWGKGVGGERKGSGGEAGSPNANMTQYEIFQSRFPFFWILRRQNPPPCPTDAKNVHTLILRTETILHNMAKEDSHSR